MAKMPKMSNVGQMQIGDYADLTIKGKIHRYHIVKIMPKEIKISPMDDSDQTFFLIKKGDNFQINNNNIATFNKNAISTQYLERDFTVAPSKIVPIDHFSDMHYEYDSFFELKNGIILHKSKSSSFCSFFDPSFSENRMFLQTQIIKYESEYKILDFSENNSNQYNSNQDNSNQDNSNQNNSNDEIYAFLYGEFKIVKLNLNDFTHTNIYQFREQFEVFEVYPLRNKKVFCISTDGLMFVLDLTTNKEIAISYLGEFEAHPIIHQLSNEDIILWSEQIISDNNANEIVTITIYHINLNDGTLNKIFSSTLQVDIIAVLKDDTILLSICDFDKKTQTIRLWTNANINVNNLNWDTFSELNQNIEIPLPKIDKEDMEPAEPLYNLLLENGDVLFAMHNRTYLYIFEERKIINLPLFSTEYTCDLGYIEYKQLRNGNIIVNNIENLTILEFPINQHYYDRKNYDKIVGNINNIILSKDIKGLIRQYL